ncbi:izumo sperm-egg fusion 1-like protein [Labeo rohita]|uniref:Izumo sperm-egg fusion 1-like protein n=1 Tax=Labeo rohita TaxID=84645 RepID=A0A498MAL9_LABRO|nr:izumo sperm-egg fusion 1-like protein [Labeo rohita]
MDSYDKLKPYGIAINGCIDSFSRVSCCLQCDQVVRYVHEDFLSSVKGITVRDQIELKQIIEHAYVNFRDTSRLSRGVIDPTTLYRARTEYQSEFKRHWKEDRTGSIQWDMINILEKGKRILQKHLEIFVAQERHVEADEGEEVVLDCFLPWHALVVGQTEYHYSWHPREKNVHAHRQTNTFSAFKES